MENVNENKEHKIPVGTDDILQFSKVIRITLLTSNSVSL